MSTLDLQKFCAREDDPRTYLCTPWAHKGWIYATNGHILVRVPSPEHAETASDLKPAQSVIDMFAKAVNTGFAPLPEFEPAPKCYECFGKGQFKQSKCNECGGEGTFFNGHNHYECKSCETEGWVEDDSGEMRECPYCLGWGVQSKRIPLGDTGYQGYYLSMIAPLPGLLFAPGEPEKAAHFIFDGGEGLLMPMRERS